MTALEQINELTARIKQLSTERDALLQEWAAATASVKIGDEVTAQGWSHKNKRCRVLAVKGELSWDNQPQIRIVTRLLKKDGTNSAHTTNWIDRPDIDEAFAQKPASGEIRL